MILWDKTKVYDRYVCGFRHPSVSVIIQSEDREGDVALLRGFAGKIPPHATECLAVLERRGFAGAEDLAEAVAALVATLECSATSSVTGQRH